MILSVTACSNTDMINELNLNTESKDATDTTAKENSAVYSMLDFSDTSEWENATEGLIDTPDSLEIVREDGRLVWSVLSIYMGKKDAVKENAVIKGDAAKFDLILDNMNSFSITDDVYFNIIEP